MYFHNLFIKGLNIHNKDYYLMSMLLLERIDETGVLKYIFQNKISKCIMLFILLADVKNAIKIVHQSIIIMKCTHFVSLKLAVEALLWKIDVMEA